jgi:hypothetical protein
MSQIMVMFHQMHAEHSQFQELMRNFREFMSARRLPFRLQAKVKRYLEFHYKSSLEMRYKRLELMDHLSFGLQMELQVHLNRNVLIQKKFFSEMPETVLGHICCLATTLDCAPGDAVVEKGQNTGKMFFLVRGKLHVKMNENVDLDDINDSDDSDDEGFLVGPPFSFGSHNLVSPAERAYQVVSVAHSELLSISYEDIQALKKEFPHLTHILDFTQIMDDTGEDDGDEKANMAFLARQPTLALADVLSGAG